MNSVRSFREKSQVLAARGDVPVQLVDARMLAPLVRFLDDHGRRSQPFLDSARVPGDGWLGSTAGSPQRRARRVAWRHGGSRVAMWFGVALSMLTRLSA